jgi:isopentenyldiphosphate isomerase
MKFPPVVIVDDQDNIVGEAMLEDAWEQGLIHRVVIIVLEDKKGRILLQRRSPHVGLYPNCWEITAAGHVDVTPDYKESAAIELQEEIGLEVPLKEAAHYYTDEPYADGTPAKRFVKIFRGRTEQLPDTLSEFEVSKVRWFTKAELHKLMKERPEEVAISLLDAYRRVLS